MSKAFTLIKEEQVSELNSTAKLYVHKRTGARLLSIINDDENKVFGINFRTTPKDLTGVAHILEHSVLGGSEKYPVKEPFVELLKGSLATYINANTFPDKTCYPIASPNLQDFYNLIDVYMDAVLHPLITEQTLMQEGWHFEINDPAEPLTYKGVVFNEMKGAYSSPEGVLETRIIESLFPKHIYSVDSGGDPRNIPDLTYADFKAFWENYYHPSNSFIFFYGNDDPDARLKLMEGYLKSYKRKKVKSTVKPAKPFKRAKKVEYSYDAGSDTDIESKNYLVVNWALPETTDPILNFSLRILGSILIGTPASPLKKALLDSGLGEDLAGLGLETELRHLIFSTGLKGTRARHAKKIERLIVDTLEALVHNGIDPDMITASVNTAEFRLRENNTGSFPRGIALMRRVLTTWIHDDEDPFKLLGFEATLNEIKARLAADPRYFERLIKTHLLENPHRTTLRLKPDPELARRLEEEEIARLAKIRESLDGKQIAEMVKNTKNLKLMQETPNAPEAVATLPVLKLKDLEKENKSIPIEITQLQDTQVLYHDLFTNGIVYLDLGFDLHAMPQEYLPLTEIFARALLEMGTESEDYVKLSQRIGKSTGGIYGDSLSTTAYGSKENVSKLFIRGKATMNQSTEMLNILKDILLTTKFDNRERLKQIVLEEKSGVESGLVPGGHIFANRRVRAQFGGSGWVNDQMSGIGYLFALRELAKDIDKKWPSVLKKLETMRDTLINRSLICNVTLDAVNWAAFKPRLENFIFALPDKEVTLKPFDIKASPEKEGLTIPAQVNYVGKAANLYDLGYEFDGSADVITGYLRMAYLWEKIRVLGGAYGGFCVFDENSGVFSFLSYRDPNLDTTLENYDNAAGYLKNLDPNLFNDNELTKAIIAAIGDLDTYQLPDAKGYTSMMRHLTGKTDAMLQKKRDEILSTNGEDFISFGEVLEKAAKSEAVAVIGSQAAIEGSKAGLKVTKVL